METKGKWEAKGLCRNKECNTPEALPHGQTSSGALGVAPADPDCLLLAVLPTWLIFCFNSSAKHTPALCYMLPE